MATSIAEVALNPGDPWAWAGLVGDVVDAAKTVKKLVSESTGAYEIVYKSGKNYVGKGPFSRAITSAIEHARPNKLNNELGDEVLSITWKKASNEREAFIMEYLMQVQGQGVLSANKVADTYNQIWSPGRKYLSCSAN